MDSDTLHYAIAPDEEGVHWSVWYASDDASSHIRALSGRGSQRCVHPASSASQALKVMRTLGARLVDKSVCAGVSGVGLLDIHPHIDTLIIYKFNTISEIKNWCLTCRHSKLEIDREHLHKLYVNASNSERWWLYTQLDEESSRYGLCFSGNLSVEFTTHLISILTNGKEHRELILHNSKMHGEMLKELIQALPTTLRHLVLRGNNIIKDADAEHIANALLTLTNLKELNLSDNSIGDAGAQSIANALPELKQLKELNLSGNDIGAAGAQSIASALPELKQLKELNLSGNDIGEAGAQSIANALPELKQLKELNLEENYIGDAGAQSIASALPELKQLKELNLSGNDIGAAGAQSIASALKFKNLNVLHLSYNSIGAAGAQSIASALPELKQLKELNLSSNRIGDAGTRDIAIRLFAFPAMTHLNLGYNEISNTGAERIADGLRTRALLVNLKYVSADKMPRFELLSLSGNQVDDDTVALLKSYCDKVDVF